MIAVMGAAGNVGSKVADLLLRQDQPVRCWSTGAGSKSSAGGPRPPVADRAADRGRAGAAVANRTHAPLSDPVTRPAGRVSGQCWHVRRVGAATSPPQVASGLRSPARKSTP